MDGNSEIDMEMENATKHFFTLNNLLFQLNLDKSPASSCSTVDELELKNIVDTTAELERLYNLPESEFKLEIDKDKVEEEVEDENEMNIKREECNDEIYIKILEKRLRIRDKQINKLTDDMKSLRETVLMLVEMKL